MTPLRRARSRSLNSGHGVTSARASASLATAYGSAQMENSDDVLLSQLNLPWDHML